MRNRNIFFIRERIVDKFRTIFPLNYGYEATYNDFFETFERYITSRNLSLWRIKHLHGMKRALARFQEYRRLRGNTTGYRLRLETLQVDDLYDFERFLRSEYLICEEFPQLYEPSGNGSSRRLNPKPKGDNTIVEMMAMLRAFFRWCMRQGIINTDPFVQYAGRTTGYYGTPYYLTVEERNHIADFDLSSTPSLAVQRDIFIFQCLIGCRVSDLLALKTSSIINGAVEYLPRKTRGERPETVRVPLNRRAVAIVERYAGAGLPGGRLLPFISAQKYNEAIKKIFTRCGVTRLVTVLNPVTGEEEKRPVNEIASSHLARRTFIGNLYKKIKDPNLVGSMSGHKEGSKAFARYRVIDDDIKRELVSLLE